MIKRKMLPISECDDTAKRRVVVYRDKYIGGREDQGEHMFIRWGRHPRYDFSDKKAECPINLTVLGREQRIVPKKGLFAFAVDLYDHSGLSFSLGELNPDPNTRGFDTTYGAAYLYLDRARFEKFQGKDRWMMVPTNDGWDAPWRPAKDVDEFTRLTLQPCAESEIEEMNLISSGHSYGFRVEVSHSWTKTYDTGAVTTGVDWENDPDESGSGGFLTEHADGIDFPREPDLPVYYEDDVCLASDPKRGLGPYEYIVYEFLVKRKADGGMYYAGPDEDGAPTWTHDPFLAKVFLHWGEACDVAQKSMPEDEYDGACSVVRKDTVEKELLNA